MATISLTLTTENEQQIGVLTGELTRHNVPSLPRNLSKQLVSKPAAVLDFTKVTRVDTAGLAWMLAQVELAQANACQLVFAHLPSELIKLAKLSGVEDFLSIKQPS